MLVTGFDILFFWVARMVMIGLHFTGEAPFAPVHLTGLVRDAEGQKMSKTKGNVIDPDDLVEEYGADALRFTLASLDSPGRDIPLDREQMAGYRAFGNKIWNATRFALSRIAEAPGAGRDRSRRARRARALDPLAALAHGRGGRRAASRPSASTRPATRSTTSSGAILRLVHRAGQAGARRASAPRPQVGDVLLTVLDRALRLLHPVMPFLTEELWQRLPGHEAIHRSICLAPYPAAGGVGRREAEADGRARSRSSTRVRALRTEMPRHRAQGQGRLCRLDADAARLVRSR